MILILFYGTFPIKQPRGLLIQGLHYYPSIQFGTLQRWRSSGDPRREVSMVCGFLGGPGLVGGINRITGWRYFNPSEKYEFVSRDDDITN